jgi:hypothetical protein
MPGVRVSSPLAGRRREVKNNIGLTGKIAKAARMVQIATNGMDAQPAGEFGALVSADKRTDGISIHQALRHAFAYIAKADNEYSGI